MNVNSVLLMVTCLHDGLLLRKPGLRRKDKENGDISRNPGGMSYFLNPGGQQHEFTFTPKLKVSVFFLASQHLLQFTEQGGKEVSVVNRNALGRTVPHLGAHSNSTALKEKAATTRHTPWS